MLGADDYRALLHFYFSSWLITSQGAVRYAAVGFRGLAIPTSTL